MAFPEDVKLSSTSNGISGSQDSDSSTNNLLNMSSQGYYRWLFFCATGTIVTLSMYGVVLEYATSGGRQLHELSFVFITTCIYTVTAFVMRRVTNEKPVLDLPKVNYVIIALTSSVSMLFSVGSLRYVIYPVQVLFKSCKPVAVMFWNVVLGKRYPMRKYINVIFITVGVALFMGAAGATKEVQQQEGQPRQDSYMMTIMGGALLLISLCCDGVTGAYEDKLVGNYHVEPFDLMYNIQLGKALLSFFTIVVTGSGMELYKALTGGDAVWLLVLGLTGALGQSFAFITISKFGALNCSLIGLVRKILSILLSFLMYSHQLNILQSVGLVLSIGAMAANFYEKSGSEDGKKLSLAPDLGDRQSFQKEIMV